MKKQVVHWNTSTWSQKLDSCSKSAIITNLICKTTYRVVHRYQMLNSQNFIGKLLRNQFPPLHPPQIPISLLPSSCQHFKWQQSPGDISPVGLNLCLCKRIRANCYIMTRCDHRDGDVWNALPGKRWFGFFPYLIEVAYKTQIVPNEPTHVTAGLATVTGPKEWTQRRTSIFIHKWAMLGKDARQKEIRSVKIKPILDLHSSQSPLRILFITQKHCQKDNAGFVRRNLNFRTKMENRLLRKNLQWK